AQGPRRLALARNRRRLEAGKAQVPARARRVRARPVRLPARRACPRRARAALAARVLHAARPARAVPVRLTRQHWEDGHRRFARQREDARLYRQLLGYVEAVGDELRRRVGSTFALAELADCYRGAEHWAREAIEERAAEPGWPRWIATAVDEAFYLYQ